MHIGSREGKQAPAFWELLLNLLGAGRRTGDEACPAPSSQESDGKEPPELENYGFRGRGRETTTCTSAQTLPI